MSWWDQPFRIFQTNLREIDAGLDVQRVLDDLESFHASVWLLNTGGIVSFYPSALPYQHPSPWLAERDGGDLIGEAVEAAHARGVRVLSRVDFSKLHRDVYEAHPDWFVANERGEPQVYNELYSACPSGPYYQQHSFDVLAEIMDRYPIDGFFFNMFTFAEWDYSGNYHGICHCANCRRRFREWAGLDLPAEAEERGGPAWRAHRGFRQWTTEDLAARICSFIHEKSPGVGLFLYSDAGDGDVALYEINNAISRPLPYWSHHAGEVAKRSQGVRPGVPVTINSVLFLDIPYRFAAEQPGLVSLRLAQIIAHGGNPYVYVLGTTAQHDRRNHAAVRDLYAYHEREAADYAGLASPARIALVQPARSVTHYGGGEGRAGVTAAYRGFYRVLVETHEQFDVLPDRCLPDKETDGQLDRYELLVLPNAACLADEEARAVDGFVRRGGRVVATGETGLYGARGESREEPALACLGVEGVALVREDMRSGYLRIRDDERALFAGFEESDLLALLGRYLYVRGRAGCETSLVLIPPARYGPPEKCYWTVETEWPGVLWYALGKGRTAAVPWQPDRVFYELCLPEYRWFLSRLVQELRVRPPLVETDAGPLVEVIVRDQPATGRRVVHLVNYTGQNGRAFHGHVELRDLHVRAETEHDVGRVRAAMLGEDLDFSPVDGGVAFDLPRLGLLEKVVLE